MERVNFYDLAGLQTLQAGRLMSTHVGDDLAWSGFQEGANVQTSGSTDARASHPALGPANMLVGFAALVVLIMYMDHRIKVPI